MEEKHAKVGIAAMVWRDGKVLIGKRVGLHGTNMWGFPGGHLDFAESWEACAAREVMEETGMTLTKATFVAATNDIFTEKGKHYITLFMNVEVDGEPRVLEPDKCERWEWYSWDDLPRPLFLPIENLLKTGFNPTII